MSFQRSTLKITFDDPEFVGLEIKTRRLPIGAVLELTALQDLDAENRADALAALARVIEMIDKYLIAWNLTEGDDEEAVPCTLTAVDPQMAMQILMGIAKANGEVPDFLRRSSDSGQQSLEELIPMETYSGDPIA